MKVKVPGEFRIGATPVHVSLCMDMHSDEGYNGTFNVRTGELHIDGRLFGAKRDKTFLHELNEVIKENYDLDSEERDMTSFANGLLEFLSQLDIELDWSDIPTQSPP